MTTYQKTHKKMYRDIHKWLRGNFGNAYKCEGDKCKKISSCFEYALIAGKEYEYNRENYKMLCRSCHSIYDQTDEIIKKKADFHRGRKRSEKTKTLMSEAAKASGQRPPPKTKEQIEELRTRMIGNTMGFKKGLVPWNKGTNPEYVQGKNHPMYGKIGKKSPNWSRIKTKCNFCKKVLYVHPSRMKLYKTFFCNQGCRTSFGTTNLRKRAI